jgi:hypothetical protein
MMEVYGRAVIEERLQPRQFAEIAAYVRREYGPGVGPGFLLAGIANGAAGGPRKRRIRVSRGVIRTLAKAMKALVNGGGNVRKAKAPNSSR